MFMSIQSFTIAIPQATLDDVRERLARTRWPDGVAEAGLGLWHEPELPQEPGGVLAAPI